MICDAPPTQAEIADAPTLQSSSRQAQRQSREEGAVVAERIYADWLAAHEQGRRIPDLASLKEFAQKLGGVEISEKLRDGPEAARWRRRLADSYEELNAGAKPGQRAAVDEFLPGVDVRPVARSAATRGPTAGHGVLDPAAALTVPSLLPQQQPPGVER
ncbi:hypothetical protein [Streptomyces sp. NPDC050263]|uniref:hypothetical protein n=1 Tax=Streptomyces sp. NPDC050263 TaxID=3155037 RepID=UPI00342C3DA4